MNDNELNRVADLIFFTLNHKQHRDENKEDLIKIIKSILITVFQEQRKIGRIQAINSMKDTIERLKEL